MENPEGCTRCFCFGRSDKCIEAGFTWDQETANDRILTLKYDDQLHQVIKLVTNHYNELVKIILHFVSRVLPLTT